MIETDLVDAAVFVPRYLQSSADWIGHSPFSCWLIKKVRPNIFVELGVRSGNSYFSYCQAVDEAALLTKCYAVAAAQNDGNTGEDSEDLFARINAYHEKYYTGFSQLLRMTFDQAVSFFSDRSIDLLHIDGQHTYEVACNNFETWLPKLAPGAVVLLHNTNLREPNIEVWKLWQELQLRYPRNLEFRHSNGLGILQLSDAPSGTQLEWLQPESSEKQQIIEYFAALGLRQLERYELVKLRPQVSSLNQIIYERGRQLADIKQVVRDRDWQLTDLKKRMLERDQQIIELHHSIEERDLHLNVQQNTVQIKELELHKVNSQLDTILHSQCWRLTSPIRKVMSFIRRRQRSSRESTFASDVQLLRNSELFDTTYYLANNPDVQQKGLEPIEHYLLHGWEENRDPSAAFSTSQYFLNNPDIAQEHINPLVHFLRHGQREGRSLGPQTSLAVIDAEVETLRASGLFDESYYLAIYTDMQPPPTDAIRHYCEQGWREGRNPSEDFDTRYYLRTYGDIRENGINPLWHYVVAGASERRHVIADSSAMRLEADIWFGVVNTDIKLLAFYESPDWVTVRKGKPLFKGHLQPLLPHDSLRFYDPLDYRVMKRQAEMAKRHGLFGFCFSFREELDLDSSSHPVKTFLAHDEIDFHFCIRVELGEKVSQNSQMALLAKAVADRRFIRIDDRPVILVTAGGKTSGSTNAVAHLRQRLSEQGINNLFLIGQWTGKNDGSSGIPPKDLYDAVIDLHSPPAPGETGGYTPKTKNGVDTVSYGIVASQGVARARNAPDSLLPLFLSVTLGRDNTTQNPIQPLAYTRFHVRDYRRWLDAAIAATRTAFSEDRRFLFINAWNDWNAGLFLEPDRQGGACRLNETTRALLGLDQGETKMPKVSVIVPNYNHEVFLRRRLDSIYEQTYRNIEVILLDDCSSDQSQALLDQYAGAHPEITRTLYNTKNSGSVFRQWAQGIKAATGDLVWIAESDDYCDEHFLETLVRCFEDEAVLLAYAKTVFVDRDEHQIDFDLRGYLQELGCEQKWDSSYVETAHNEVNNALGIKNTIPNASGVLFKRPITMPLLDDETWLSMVVAGDWVFYLHAIRGGKIAYSTETTNYFRRYKGSAAEVTYKREAFYREVGLASRTVAALYRVPLTVLEQCRQTWWQFYQDMVGGPEEEFANWYNYQAIRHASEHRAPNVMISTMGFYPGGAEILPIKLANEFKRRGLSVLFLNVIMNPSEDGVRRMLASDVPVVETSSVPDVKAIIHDYGVEVLHSHQWHVQKYPLHDPEVFAELRGHIASLHGMIEHGDAFGATEEQLRTADQWVTTWVYTAEKNLVPFSDVGLYDSSSPRFVKLPNGIQTPNIVPIPRAEIGIPEDAFVFCCVSRAIPDKGWAETIQVIEKARELSGQDIRLILVGNGIVYDEYCRVGAPSFVYLAGFSEDSVGHYATADMGIMLTRFKSESFPLTIVDCLFAGKPYIATDVGDIRNMLTTPNGIAGEIISLEDWEIPIEKAAHVVASFVTDQHKRSRAQALVPEVANRYRIEVVASQYIKLFENCRSMGPRAVD